MIPKSLVRFPALVAVLAGVLAAGGLSPNSAHAAPLTCSPGALNTGACATFVTSPGNDPLVEATRALALAGKDAQATNLLDAVKGVVSSTELDEARAVLANPEPASSGTVNSGTAPGRVTPRGIYVDDAQWELDDAITYGYCSSSGCQVLGTAQLGVWHDLHWYSQTGPGVAGTFLVKTGPAVQFTTLSCKTFYEVFPFDQVLKDWSNCRDAGYSGYTNVRQIDWADWKQGSAVGTQYHLEVTVDFEVQGGGNFHGLWNSNSYRITSPTSAKFLH